MAENARADRENTYPELVESNRCALVVVALETGGRWSEEAANFVEEPSYARARDAPVRLRRAAALSWQRRWVRLLSTAAAKAYASSLVAPPRSFWSQAVDGEAPQLSELLSDVRSLSSARREGLVLLRHKRAL